jgi:hypothetical protein
METTKCLQLLNENGQVITDGLKSINLIIEEKPQKETDKAVFVMVLNSDCGSNKDFWIPKSLLKQVESNGVKCFSLPEWFIRKTFSNLI